MSGNNSLPILNPGVYLNYLTPDLASEYEAIKDIFLVTFGALVWDILSSIPSDWKIIRTTKPTPVLFAYFSSRLFALAVVLMSAFASKLRAISNIDECIFSSSAGPVQNCGVIQLIICIFLVLATGSSSYLFLKRVHAVFFQERLVCHIFTALWIGAVGASTLVLIDPLHDYYEIANTKHCMNVKVNAYVSAAFLVPMVFDALVHSAISFKILLSHPRATTQPRSWKNFCSSKTLPRLSRAVLQGGQRYYMITNGVNVSCSNLVLSSTASPILQLSLSVPAIALTSAMACRVFRNLKLETSEKTPVEALTTIHFANRERVNVHLPKNTEFAFPEADLEKCL